LIYDALKKYAYLPKRFVLRNLEDKLEISSKKFRACGTHCMADRRDGSPHKTQTKKAPFKGLFYTPLDIQYL